MAGSDFFPTRTETFDVVMLKTGISEFAAKPDDFKRVTVEASDALQAQLHDDVAKEKEHRVLMVTAHGALIEAEVLALRRAAEDEAKATEEAQKTAAAPAAPAAPAPAAPTAPTT